MALDITRAHHLYRPQANELQKGIDAVSRLDGRASAPDTDGTLWQEGGVASWRIGEPSLSRLLYRTSWLRLPSATILLVRLGRDRALKTPCFSEASATSLRRVAQSANGLSTK